MGTYLFLDLGGDGQVSVLLLGRGWPCICFFFGEIACCQDFQFLLTPRTPSLNIQFLFLIKKHRAAISKHKEHSASIFLFLFRMKNTGVAKQPFPVFPNFPPATCYLAEKKKQIHGHPLPKRKTDSWPSPPK